MKYLCHRCGHKWNPRKKEKPKICPKCKSPYWDKPKERVSKRFVEDYKEEIIKIHSDIIKESGGEAGIRDKGGLHHAAYQILRYITKNKDDPVSIGAKIYDDLAKRHYFVDGNKRTAHCFAKMVLITLDHHLKIRYKQALDFILKIARHNNPAPFNEIKTWIQKNLIKIKDENLKRYLKEVYFDICNKEDEKK